MPEINVAWVMEERDRIIGYYARAGLISEEQAVQIETSDATSLQIVCYATGLSLERHRNQILERAAEIIEASYEMEEQGEAVSRSGRRQDSSQSDPRAPEVSTPLTEERARRYGVGWYRLVEIWGAELDRLGRPRTAELSEEELEAALAGDLRRRRREEDERRAAKILSREQERRRGLVLRSMGWSVRAVVGAASFFYAWRSIAQPAPYAVDRVWTRLFVSFTFALVAAALFYWPLWERLLLPRMTAPKLFWSVCAGFVALVLLPVSGSTASVVAATVYVVAVLFGGEGE